MKSLKKRHVKFLDLVNKSKVKNFKTAFENVLNSGNFILGKHVDLFEKQFAKYLGVKYCIGVGNGLEAIQIALMASNIGKGDQIITTPISAVATILAILAVGAKPIFVDIREDGQIDCDQIHKRINKKTKAILPVHLYGNSTNLDKLQEICKKNGLILIEDGAQAHGSTYSGKKLGSFGALGCFSFYPTKNLGAFGDGGAIVTNSKKLAQICFEIRDYGQSDKYKHTRYGLNSRLDEIQAAILSIKLKILDKENKKRRSLAKRYIKNLSEVPDIEIITPQDKSTPNYHQFVIKSFRRNALQKFLSSYKIPTLIHYPKILPDQPFLKEYKKINLPIAREFVRTCLSLPIDPKLNSKDIDYISSKILEFFKK